MTNDTQLDALLAAHDTTIDALLDMVAQVLAQPRCRCADGPGPARCDRQRGEVVVDSAGELAEEF